MKNGFRDVAGVALAALVMGLPAGRAGVAAAADDGWMTAKAVAASNALAQAEAAAGATSPSLVDPLEAYALALLDIRDYEGAQAQFQRALDLQGERFKSLDGQDLGPLFLRRMVLATGIGNVLLAQDRVQEAQTWYLRANRLSQRGLGMQGAEVRHLRTVTALATVHRLPITQVEGFYDELYRAALRAYPKKHPDIALILNYWSAFLGEHDTLEKATELTEAWLEAAEIAHGGRHPQVADAKARLASLYFAGGRRAKVRPLLKEVLDIRRAAFGENHELTRRAVGNLDAFDASN